MSWFGSIHGTIIFEGRLHLPKCITSTVLHCHPTWETHPTWFAFMDCSALSGSTFYNILMFQCCVCTLIICSGSFSYQYASNSSMFDLHWNWDLTLEFHVGGLNYNLVFMACGSERYCGPSLGHCCKACLFSMK